MSAGMRIDSAMLQDPWMEFVDMERVLEELEILASHWDHRGIPPVTDVSGHDSRQDMHQSSPSEDSSR